MAKARSKKALYKAAGKAYPRKPGLYCMRMKSRMQCTRVLRSGKLKFVKNSTAGCKCSKAKKRSR